MSIKIQGSTRDLKDLDDKSLQFNLTTTKVILDTFDKIRSEKHLRALAADAFNLLVTRANLQELEPYEVMKVNLLAAAIDGGMTLEGTRDNLVESVFLLVEELLLRAILKESTKTEVPSSEVN